ncbi:MAG: CDP-alcohol phosphatidyltransferase family protein [Alphaproteobacteria bacterium]|nr:CDP-alcohol phosphatidyltransferase family protein [Alphaproteobacteria bacterium]
MFDARLRPLIDPPLNAAGRSIAAAGISADALTLAGAAVGVGAGVSIAFENYLLGLGLVLVSRILDGLDGAVARATSITDFGGYLDILADFVFYVAVPVGFGLAAPANAIPALILAGAFALTGVSFLSFAAVAGRRGETTTAHGAKSFFYSTGIAEGAETIAAFIAMCLFPNLFGVIAYGYAALCVITVAQRTLIARRQFRQDD